jgi:hypothetical protein
MHKLFEDGTAAQIFATRSLRTHTHKGRQMLGDNEDTPLRAEHFLCLAGMLRLQKVEIYGMWDIERNQTK